MVGVAGGRAHTGEHGERKRELPGPLETSAHPGDSPPNASLTVSPAGKEPRKHEPLRAVLMEATTPVSSVAFV